MNRWIFVGLICARLFNSAIKILDSDKKVFTLHYDGYSIHFSKHKYIQLIQCMCSSRNSTNLMVSVSGQRKEIDVTESAKCEMDNIPLEKLSIACMLTYSKDSKGNIDFLISCKTDESDQGNTKTENIFTLNYDQKCRGKCFNITWWSDGHLNLKYYDLDVVNIHKQSYVCTDPELKTRSTSNVGSITANFSQSLTTANYSESLNASKYVSQTSRDKIYSISTIAYVLSAIFISCIVSFFLGLKRISLHTLFRRNFSIFYRKINANSCDTEHTSNVNDQEQAFSDPIPTTSERLYLRPLVNEEDIVNDHTAFWHRETNGVGVRANESVVEALEQETCLNNVLDDGIYADPEIILNLVNASSNETQTTENQRRMSTGITSHSTVPHKAIQLVAESETNVRYYEVEFQPEEDYYSQTVHETNLKRSAESDVTTTTHVDKVYETPQPITDTIYYTLRRKGNIFKHNYESIPLEIESSHTSITFNERSRLSTFYEIAFDEEEDDNIQMIHHANGFVSEESQGICVDSENPLLDKTIYSSLRQKKTFKHNYEIIATVIESPCIHRRESTLEILSESTEQNIAEENRDEHQTSHQPISSTHKEHDDVMINTEDEEDTIRHTTINDVSCSFQQKMKSYNDLDLPNSSSQLQVKTNLNSYIEQEGN